MINDEKVSFIYCILLHFVVNSQKETKNNLNKIKKKKELKSFGSFQKTNFINLKVAKVTRIVSALECIYIGSLQISITGVHQS